MRRRVFEMATATGATGSALVSAAASICCIGPLAITVLGVQGAIWAAGIKPYRYYLLGGSLVLIGLAYLLAYRPPRMVAGASCATPVSRITRLAFRISAFVWFAALILNVAIDRGWI